MNERAKLIETVTQQDGINRGLESERERWSRDLADRTRHLAQEKSEMQIEGNVLLRHIERTRLLLLN